MRIVTTCHKAGFEEYGHRLLETFKHFPQGTELWWYTEGYNLPKTDGVVEISLDKLYDLQAFKLRHANFVPPNYLFDVVRFSHKIYAAVDALMDYKGIGAWLDADVLALKDIPPNYLESHLRKAYIACFKRKGMYTETGFWIADCSHEQHQAFMSTLVEWYDSGVFKTLPIWTDSEVFDATVRRFEKNGLISTVSMSGAYEHDMHPMAKVDLAQYLDHCKGARKAAGFSPENANRHPVCEVGQ
jgi:hypothetical protein